MKLEQVKEIANAILYEGYLLYPYRQSAIKNRTRWTFGGIYPREYSEGNGGRDPWTMRTECLLEGQAEHLSLDITIRFLHLLVRTVVPPDARKDEQVEELSDTWGLASRFADEPLQEGRERDLSILDLSLKDVLFSPRCVAIEFPATCTVEYPPDAHGIEIIREQQALSGVCTLSAERVATTIFKLSITIENTTSVTGDATNRHDAILFQSFISTHTILQVHRGSFISLLEPLKELQPLVSECHNLHTWPVLVGEQGERDTLLSSPIILYDYPQIAPESPGPLFDGGEIDEILSLRILTLSDEEKKQMRQDEHTREILERTEALTPDQFMKMHGTIRDLRPNSKGEKA
ncbi:hypothetical protein [Dictyobacter arantiisoli]|uniref:Uncharacterized protein n=1 Tax=Dictyobacter arantiisoli TaxID=2014874 RepID=A0A5A5TG41_9CHLR|nr:hypothetical protein [Dictyobacter arantiisoli]GCF09969.1 hypothetical protein KDI_35330 [Dictyobacter arantiisoli]